MSAPAPGNGQVPPEQWVRAQVMHDAVNFHTFRGTPEEIRLTAVADTASRMEHYVHTGVFPLEQDWMAPAVADTETLGGGGQ